MQVTRIMPANVGNRVITNKAKQAPSNNYANSTNVMEKSTANALKAMVAFKGAGIEIGRVEDNHSVSISLNGAGKVADKVDFMLDGIGVKSTLSKDETQRQISISKDGNEIIRGFIKNSTPAHTKIDFNVAKHKPEIKLTLNDGTTIQMLEGSKLRDEEGNFAFEYAGSYKVIGNSGNVVSKKVNLDESQIAFKGNFVSLLCKKDSTVKATNEARDAKAVTVGDKWDVVAQDDPTFAVLAGGFGTRFANMTTHGENKPSFNLPNGLSLVSTSFDLIKNATNADSLGNITYLEQNSKNDAAANHDLIPEMDTIIPMNAFSSDGGAVMRAVMKGDIPSDKPLVILNADTITNVDISQSYAKMKELNGAIVIPAFPVGETRAKSFGLMSAGAVVDRDNTQVLNSFIEKPSNPSKDASTAMVKGKTVNGEQAYYGNPGIYIFSEKVLQNLDTILPIAERIALEKDQAKARKDGKPEPQQLKDPFSKSTFLGNAFVPAVVEACAKGLLKNDDGTPMKAYMTEMLTNTGEAAYWDDLGAAEPFVTTCQDIAYETFNNGTSADNKFFGIRGLNDFRRSVDIDDGVVYASPADKANFENKHAHQFVMDGNIYITSK